MPHPEVICVNGPFVEKEPQAFLAHLPVELTLITRVSFPVFRFLPTATLYSGSPTRQPVPYRYRRHCSHSHLDIELGAFILELKTDAFADQIL